MPVDPALSLALGMLCPRHIHAQLAISRRSQRRQRMRLVIGQNRLPTHHLHWAPFSVVPNRNLSSAPPTASGAHDSATALFPARARSPASSRFSTIQRSFSTSNRELFSDK